MATQVAGGELQVLGTRPRIGWALGGLSALALIGVLIATVSVVTGPTVRPIADRQAPLYTQDELTVVRLAEAGVIPAETLDGEPFRTKALINRGLVPRAALEAAVLPAPPLYCGDEIATIAAVNQGLVPREALQDEPFRTKTLVNQGLIPRAAVEPC